MIAVLTGTSAAIFAVGISVFTGLAIVALLASSGRRPKSTPPSPPSEKLGLFSAPVVALGFVLLHYFTPNDDSPRYLRSNVFWLGVLGFLLLFPVLFLPVASRQRRRRQLARDHPRRVSRRSYDLMLFQTIGNSLFIPLVLVAIVLIGAPWWAVLVAACPFASGLAYLVRSRPNLDAR